MTRPETSVRAPGRSRSRNHLALPGDGGTTRSASAAVMSPTAEIWISTPSAAPCWFARQRSGHARDRPRSAAVQRLTYRRARMPTRSLIDRYRRAGADPPWFDPRRDHGAPFEGYYWRFSDRACGRVVIALCGLCRQRGRRWAVLALAAHPGGRVRELIVEPADADSQHFGVRA